MDRQNEAEVVTSVDGNILIRRELGTWKNQNRTHIK